MIATFRYLILTEAKNRLRKQAARLRSPRYALALVVGLAYFWFAFGGSRAFGDAPASGPGEGITLLLRTAGPLLVALYAGLTWIFGKADALAFKPAEVHLLFPGPLTRGDLLRYKLLQAQVPLAFSAAFMTLVSHGSPLPWWLRLPAMWALFSTIQLHHMAAALVHASAQQEGLVGWRRNWLPIAIFGGAAALLLASISGGIIAARAAPDLRSAFAALEAALHGDVARVILAPFRFVLAPLLATPAQWPGALGLALLVLLAHYAWVLRSDTAFEEAAVEAGERRARAVQALRSGGGWRSYARALESGRDRKRARVAPAAFRLALSGAPEIAIVWKNLTFARRNVSAATPAILIVTTVALVLLFQSGGGSLSEALREVGTMALMFGALLVVMGPFMIRNDLRMDLRSIELLRTMPLPAPRLVGAQIAASASTATIMQFTLLALGAGLIVASGDLPLSPVNFALACAGAFLLLPALATLGVTVQCAIALTFPAWVHLGAERPSGVEAMGQNILTMAGSLVLLALLLVLPVVVGGGVGLALALQWGPLAPALGGLAGIAAMYGEVVLAAQGLGRLFERTEPGDLSARA